MWHVIAFLIVYGGMSLLFKALEELGKTITNLIKLCRRKTGRWVLSEFQNDADIDNGNYSYICSNCQHSVIRAKSVNVPYCWFCGAKMEGEE